MNPIIGRGIGLLGALLILVSPFPALTDSGPSLWDFSSRMDLLVLLGALAAGALIVVDLVNETPILLPIAAGIGLFVLGLYSFFLLESKAAATGTYLGTAGAVFLVVGSLLAYLVSQGVIAAPAAAAPGFAPAAAAPAPAPAPAAAPPTPQQPPAPAPAPAQPAPASPALPPPGWYGDPSGRARLRYWDGQTWTEQTSA